MQPTNVATPLLALVGFALQMRVAPPAEVMLRVTGALLDVTVFPPAS